jgi:hypothetical protein
MYYYMSFDTYFVDVNDVDDGDEFALVSAVGDKSDATNLYKCFEALEKKLSILLKRMDTD